MMMMMMIIIIIIILTAVKTQISQKCYLLCASIPVDKVINGNLPHGYGMLIHHCNPFHDALEVHLHPALRHNLSQAEGPGNKEQQLQWQQYSLSVCKHVQSFNECFRYIKEYYLASVIQTSYNPKQNMMNTSL
jgi:hypothetical protein